MSDPGELMAVAESIAREAGALIRDHRPGVVEVAATKTSALDVVTAMDLAVEALVRRRLAELRPGDGVLGEESGLEPGTSGVTWVVDPVDGTVNYLYGLPAYAVSLAAVTGDPDPAGWTLQAGCVHAVASGNTWTAARGLGAWSNGRRLALRTERELGSALVATGFHYTLPRRRKQAEVAAALLPMIRDLRRIGSAAIDLCLVAEGMVDAHYERGCHPWDLAAGGLVAAEAGAVMIGLRGAPASVDMAVTAPPGLAAGLADLLASWDADTDIPD